MSKAKIRQVAQEVAAIEVALGINMANVTAHPFTTLTDVPHSYAGLAGKLLGVNPAEDGLIFKPASTGIDPIVVNPTTGEISCPTCGMGTGTVTSVGLTMENVIFNSVVSGSPISTSGSFAPSLKTQIANAVFAGPTSGGSATPTMRLLVAADIPSLAASIITSGQLLAIRGGTGIDSSSSSGIPHVSSGVWSIQPVASQVVPIFMAACQNTTAGLLWDSPPSGPAVASCATGANVQKGVADFAASSDLSLQLTYLLPSNYDPLGTVSARFIWSSPTTSGSVVWQLATSCTDTAQTAVDDGAFNTASTVTSSTAATANRVTQASISPVDMTGCAAGNLLHLKPRRNAGVGSDSMAGTGRLIAIELTVPRA